MERLNLVVLDFLSRGGVTLATLGEALCAFYVTKPARARERAIHLLCPPPGSTTLRAREREREPLMRVASGSKTLASSRGQDDISLTAIR